MELSPRLGKNPLQSPLYQLSSVGPSLSDDTESQEQKESRPSSSLSLLLYWLHPSIHPSTQTFFQQRFFWLLPLCLMQGSGSQLVVRGSLVGGLQGVSETLSGCLWNQSYFHNDTKMLFAFFTLVICSEGTKATVGNTAGVLTWIKTVVSNVLGSLYSSWPCTHSKNKTKQYPFC